MEKPTVPGGCIWSYFEKHYDTGAPQEFDRGYLFILDSELKTRDCNFKNFLGSKSPFKYFLTPHLYMAVESKFIIINAV